MSLRNSQLTYQQGPPPTIVPSEEVLGQAYVNLEKDCRLYSFRVVINAVDLNHSDFRERLFIKT